MAPAVNVPRPVYAGCWEARYPKAPKLFVLLGFRPTDEIADNGNRVWVLEAASHEDATR